MSVAWRTDDDVAECDGAEFGMKRSRKAIPVPKSRSRHLLTWLSIAVVVLLGTKPVLAHPSPPIIPDTLVDPYSNSAIDAILADDPSFGIVLLDPKFSSQQSQLYRRQVEDDEDEDASPSSSRQPTTTKPTSTSARSSSIIPSSTSPADNSTEIVVDDTAEFTTPRPFDTNMGANFTTSQCKTFMTSLLDNAEFNSCFAFSTLLSTSTSFFKIQTKPFQLASLLNQSCSVNVDFCQGYIENLGDIISEDQNCKVEYEEGNPVVIMARNALLSYKLLYTASCIRNERTGQFCYVEMASNTTAWADIGVFQLGNGEPIAPDTTSITSDLPNNELRRLAGVGKNAEMAFSCSECLNKVMGVLGAEAAQNEESAVHNVFKGGAEEVNKVCGSEWVNTAAIDQAVARETSGASRKRSLGGLVVAVMVGVWLL